MAAKNKDLQVIKQLLDSAESQIRQAKSLLFAGEIKKRALEVGETGNDSVIEGVFDGEMMVSAENKKFPVPPNYASKSKLIPGDVLKLTILEDGGFIFKQIGPMRRRKAVGVLEEVESGKYEVSVEGKRYRILFASVTYFKARVGDKLTIVLPAEGESEWAAVENVI
ncbi:MAG: hypothetical protein AAB360_01530 [Patescibacteria group bacterium]